MTATPDTTTESVQDVHAYFGLSYANYLVLPRMLMQSMPEKWQIEFVNLLNELHDAFEHVQQAPTYQVTAGKTLALDEMTESQLYAAGIDVEGDAEDGSGTETRYHRRSDGAELTGQDYGFLPGVDPVPHYGRAHIQPRLDNSQSSPDTLPEWLYQRFAKYRDVPPWSHLADNLRSYWQHEANAVRRAVARGGFKNGESGE
jgi:hypothetical protein